MLIDEINQIRVPLKSGSSFKHKLRDNDFYLLSSGCLLDACGKNSKNLSAFGDFPNVALFLDDKDFFDKNDLLLSNVTCVVS